MTGAVVVGYTATDAGADALVLGERLAVALGAHLHLVTVLPAEGSRNAAVPPERAYEDHIRGQARGWLNTAARTLPAGLGHSGHVRFAESFAEGLVAAAEEFGARLIVVGTATGGLFGRHRLGTVASSLVHSSSVPVALAPAGTRETGHTPMGRVTAAVGTRSGASALLDAAISFAMAGGVPLRLVSLVAFDVPPGLDTGAIRTVGDSHVQSVLSTARSQLPEGLLAEVEHAAGETVEEAVSQLDWQDGEVVLVGSSRLAQPRRLFLGSTAAKMLHELPVPMIVVPRNGAAARVEGDRA